MRYLILLGAVAAAVAGYYAYWQSLADGLTAGAEQWVAERRAQGYQVEYRGMRVHGFPFRLTMDIEAPRIGDPTHALAWDWRADWATGYLQPWNLTHVILVVDGEQHVAWTEAGKRRAVKLLAEDTRASAIFDRSGALKRYQGAMQNAELEIADLGPASFASAQVAGRNNNGEDETRPPGSVDVGLRVADLTLPPKTGGALGREIGRAVLTAFLPTPPPTDVTEPAVTAWRDGGGTIDLRDVELAWGPLEIKGDGAASLDAALRPEGKLRAEIRGYDATLDALAAAGSIRDDDVNTAKFALSLVAKPGPDGRPFVTTPLSAREGRLFIGPAPILSLPPLF